MATRIIGVADCGISADASDLLTTYGLGSCIAVTLYDPVAKVGGLLHFLLPDEMSAETACGRTNPYVYAGTGVEAIIEGCVRMGAAKRRLRVCAVGGASVMKDATFFNVGRRNQLSLERVLSHHGLFLHAEAVGGDRWRTVQLDIGTGAVWVKHGGQPDVELLAR